MTRNEFDALEEETRVWFHPTYFAFPFPGVVRTINGVKGVWINFFGDGQCHFTPLTYHTKFYDNVTLDTIKRHEVVDVPNYMTLTEIEQILCRSSHS